MWKNTLLLKQFRKWSQAIRLLAPATAFVLSGTALCAQDVSSRELEDTTPNLGLPSSAGKQDAELLSAFHGLEALPRVANLICRGSRGKHGMPVIFSTEVDLETLQAGDFRVVTKSGQFGTMHCASVLPATDPGELRTVLLIGDFGNASEDPPVEVEVIGHLHSIEGTLDYRGAAVAVTPLEDGPSLIFAEVVEDWTLVGNLGPRRTRGSLCPSDNIVQAIRVTWAGGVTLANGKEPGDAERDLYSITVVAEDGSQRTVTPAALADLGDGDNNHMLCLDTKDQPISVSFPAGILTDPNDDLNPATSIFLTKPT